MANALTAVPRVKWTDAGAELPLESDVLSGVLDDIDAAFGGGLNRNLETPQGQLASSLAAVIADKNTELSNIVNMVDPQYSSGRWQDAIARIYFIERKPAQSSVVRATLNGLAGTVVPAGTLFKDANGNLWSSTGAVTIGTGGTVDVDLASVEKAPIACPPHTLNRIYQSIPGLDAVDNAAPAVLGAYEESRADFEQRRYNSVAKNGHGSPSAIYGEVFQVPGVVDCYVMDNPSGFIKFVPPTDYRLLPHSVYVAVVGGEDEAVAQAIWRKKDVGCDYNGNTEVTVRDPAPYQGDPPEYVVKFQRPDPVAIKFHVQLIDSPSTPATAEAITRNCIYRTFNGLGTDGKRERIGSTILASRYYVALSETDVGNFLISVNVGIDAPTGDKCEVGVDQVPAIDAADIKVELV